MNTPAISESAPAARTIPAVLPCLALAREPRVRFLGRAVRPRPLAGPTPAARPALPRRNPAWEIVTGALLLVVWALLWSFFLSGVVEPGAALERQAAARATATSLWTAPWAPLTPPR